MVKMLRIRLNQCYLFPKNRFGIYKRFLLVSRKRLRNFSQEAVFTGGEKSLKELQRLGAYSLYLMTLAINL
ncbi:MAG: hypothetical protein DRG76_06070 [Deltaproteobacteria bacterium]|nr:MAG: hypothetical protein DRG76_06070 [Deltaproteobacteria bacterium]